MSNGDFWPLATWTKFNGVPGDPAQPGLLKSTMGPMEVAQQVFPTTVTGNENPIPADTVDRRTRIPTTGVTRSFATLRQEFLLAPIHVAAPDLTIATNQVTLSAQALALAEDMLFLQGEDAQLPRPAQFPNAGAILPAGDVEKLGRGLLGIAERNHEIAVFPQAVNPHRYGLRTYEAVVRGIAQFTTDAQGPPYGVILSTDVFGDANLPLEQTAFVTPASAIQSLLASGPFTMSPGLPPRTGLLASLGGKATTLYVGTPPLVEFNIFNNSLYFFTARESIQYVNTDGRALIKLNFEEILSERERVRRAEAPQVGEDVPPAPQERAPARPRRGRAGRNNNQPGLPNDA